MIHGDSKVRYTIRRTMFQGRLHCSANQQWFFVQKNRGGSIIKEHKLLNFTYTYQQMMKENTIQHRWNLYLLVHANHMSVISWKNKCPSTLKYVLKASNINAPVWKKSYNEEYQAIKSLKIYDDLHGMNIYHYSTHMDKQYS